MAHDGLSPESLLTSYYAAIGALHAAEFGWSYPAPLMTAIETPRGHGKRDEIAGDGGVLRVHDR
jgi:hypothetical protein